MTELVHRAELAFSKNYEWFGHFHWYSWWNMDVSGTMQRAFAASEELHHDIAFGILNKGMRRRGGCYQVLSWTACPILGISRTNHHLGLWTYRPSGLRSCTNLYRLRTSRTRSSSKLIPFRRGSCISSWSLDLCSWRMGSITHVFCISSSSRDHSCREWPRRPLWRRAERTLRISYQKIKYKSN